VTPPSTAAASTTVDAVRALLGDVLAMRADDAHTREQVAELRRRLDEPLRVALVGRVKAGKSTLLNALLGERLAPTDAGECTRVVTLYRHGVVPRVVLRRITGDRRVLPVHRADGALQLDLGGTPAEEVDRLEVDWPTPGLALATFVDTPGLSSLSAEVSGRTSAFLEAGHELPGADAVVFLTRQMQPDDIAFLTAFQQQTAGPGASTTTLTVLSRADEVAAGRLDSMLAAGEIAQRWVRDPAIAAVSQAVVPVAGLLALAGRMLRHRDYVALRSIATADPADTETLLLTADRFVRSDASVPVSADVRASLLERLGLFGIRLSVVLIRTGVPDAAALAGELIRRSGLSALEELIAVHFTRRGAQLKAATALGRLEALLRASPLPGDERLRAELERVRLAAHDLAELELLARLRTVDGPLPDELRDEAARLLGAEGESAEQRLGLPPDSTSPAELRLAAENTLERWRTARDDPFAERASVDAIDVVLRSCELVLAGLDGPGSARGAEPGPDPA
jgi:hypothetical protein